MECCPSCWDNIPFWQTFIEVQEEAKPNFCSGIIIGLSLFLWQWHAFSVPELQNFLVILEKEEAERVRAVEQKYTVYRQKLQQALQQHDPWPLTCYLMTSAQEETDPLTRQDRQSIQRLEPELNLSRPSTYTPKYTVYPHTDTYPFSGRIQDPPLSPLSVHSLPEERIRAWPWCEKATGCVVC